MDEDPTCSTNVGYLIPSSYRHFLHTNRPPTFSEIAGINETIQQIEMDIRSVNENIVQVRAIFKSLYTMRKTLGDRLAASRTILSPLRRLPAETLSEIFVWCLPPFPSNISVTTAPLLLQQICRRWRDIALSTPRLWSFISLDLKPDELETETSLATRWLARSGRCPLRINIMLDAEFIKLDSHPVVDVVLSHSSRWVEARMDLPPQLMQTFTSHPFPLLESFAVGNRDYFGTQWPHNSRKITFKHAPKLRSLELGHTIANLLRIGIAWHSLTILITSCTARGHLRILRECPNLMELRACVVPPEEEDSLNEEDEHYYDVIVPFQLVHLHLLHVTGGLLELMGFYMTPAEMFNGLILPALRDFRMTCSHLWEEWDDTEVYHRSSSLQTTTAFTSLISRSGCSIRALYLDRMCANADHFASYLRAMPSLENLHVRYSSSVLLTSAVLHWLTYDERAPAVCMVPKIITLQVGHGHSGVDSFPENDFIDMVKSRCVYGGCGALSQLRVVDLSMETAIELKPASLLVLEALKKTGLRVKM